MIDYLSPDYTPIFRSRQQKLMKIRDAGDGCLAALKMYYAANPVDFINDWGCTIDPRNVEINQPAVVPFILFEKQVELANWMLDLWRNRAPGVCEKSREVGASWVAVAVSCTLCLFNNDMCVGLGSRKEDLLDRLDDPSTLFFKARKFLELLPAEFRGSWDVKKHAPHLRLIFPDTNSSIIGEAGDNIGRGGRTSYTIIDEAAFLPRGDLVEASLSQTTNCRIDISTPCGMSNPFARKRHAGNISVFSLSWRDDPRKTQAWYDKKCTEIDDPVIIAQELDMSYTASVAGALIPSAWVQSAIDAHVTLGITPSGIRRAALDVADEGRDNNGYAERFGILLSDLSEWSGKGSDIYETTRLAIDRACGHNCADFFYDADGLGAGVRGDAKRILAGSKIRLQIKEFRGSGAVKMPTRQVFEGDGRVGRTNADYFANFKAQAYYALRERFRLTHKAVTEGFSVLPDKLISIPKNNKLTLKLVTELTRPRMLQNGAGKILIDKNPDGSRSPNLADAVMIAYHPHSEATETVHVPDNLFF
jgi:phage terminase large subunit